jgi:nucleotide-binding universal stress UspA family protein
MYRILLPVDENEARARAQVDAVLELPGTDDVVVDVVHIHEGMSAPDAQWAAGGFSEEYAEEMATNLREQATLPDSVGLVTEALDSADVEYAVHESAGEPGETILSAAADLDSDLLVVGMEKRSPVGKVLFGSVAQGVILDSERPVTVVPSE